MPFQSADIRDNKISGNSSTDFVLSKSQYQLSDLIVSAECMDQLKALISRVQYHDLVYDRWNLSSVLPDHHGFLANFYGESGTGKTMAAHAIADALQMPLLIVNYADIESKFVGETPKNLIRLFKYASEKHAVILFDEADALLSRRVTDMHSAADVSVNQTRSVLLTQLESFDGVILFTTNFISNYDSAFMRRISLHIGFELPDASLRQKLWERYIPTQMPAEVDILAIAGKYEGISGADIANAVVSAAFQAAAGNKEVIPQELFESAISNILCAKQRNRPSGITMRTRSISADYAQKQIREEQERGL